MMGKKLRKMAVMAALLPLTLALAMTMVSCPTEDDGGGGGGGGGGGTAGLSGKWINQSGNSLVVLEFVSNQLKITSGTDVATYFYKDAEGEIKTGTSSSNISEVFCDSYDITAGVLTFTGGKSDDDYPSKNFYRVNTLNANQWRDGVITSESKGQVWYSFNVAASTTYRMWWNDGDTIIDGGNGLKTLDVYVYAYYSNGASISFGSNDTGWSIARNFTPNASQAGTVYVRVTPYSSGGTGTFGITYTTGGTGAVTERPGAPFNPPSAIPLTANQWKDGEITADSNGAVWYSFNVTAGTLTNPAVYNIWWNESGSNGNNTKTLNVSVRGFYSDGTSAFSTASTAWTAAQVFNATKSGTVYLKVMPGTSGQTGTFGIVYNTGLGAARPGVIFNPPATALTENTWANGEITGTGSAGEAWYSLPVTGGTPYYFWWNESSSSYSSYGNRTKTLDIQVSAVNSEGTSISSFTNIDSAWGTVKSYTPTADGTVYLKVTPYYTGYTGTFGIVYSETNARPPVPVPAVAPIALTSGEWKKGEITGNSDGAVWYSFTVTANTAYRLWWNDSYNGNGFFRTLDVRASAWYGSTGENVFYDLDNGWNPSTVPSYTSTADDTVYVKVYPKNADDTGTFDIVYSDTATARPKLPFAPGDPPNPVALTADTWEEGEIATAGGDAWYSIEVTSGTTYRVWFDEAGNYGNGLKTLNVTVNAWYSDDTTTSVFSGSSGLTNAWGNSNSINYISASNTTTVYIRVRADTSGQTGTFAIVYGTGSSATMPDPLFTAPSNPIPLTADTWADGEITNSSGAIWYSFTAASGTNYRLWLNDNSSQSSNTGDGTKTLDAIVTAWYGSTGTTAIIGLDYAWTYASGQQFNPNATQAGTIYLRVSPRIAGNTGTYGIAYNSGTNQPRPPVALTVPANAIALTAGQWANDEITDSTREVWYSFTVASGTPYYLWWNDSGTYNGDGSKTLDVRVSAWYGNGNSIFDSEDSAWGTAQSFTPSATQAGTVYVRVYPNRWSDNSYNKGTFGIVYSATNTRPLIPIEPVNPTALTVDTWADGAITSSIREVWYSFTVTSGTYRVWWNESYSSDGNGTKTLGVKVSAYYTDGAVIFNDIDTAWGTAQSFTASSAGTVYLKVTPSTSSSTASGTFGIVYSTGTTRPTLPAPPNAIALTDGQWEDGAITAAGGEVWYSFTVVSGTTYRVWWNDSWQGNSTKTMDVKVGGWYGGTGNLVFSEYDSAWTTAQSFTPNATQAGTVYLKVTSNASSTATGTFGVVYTADNATRPVIPFDPPDATALTEGVWAAGNIPTSSGQQWFSFTATTTGSQYIHASFGTLSDLYVQVYDNSGSTVSSETNLWSGARNTSRTVTSGQEYYVRVRPYGSGSGDYKIAFNTSSTAPALP